MLEWLGRRLTALRRTDGRPDRRGVGRRGAAEEVAFEDGDPRAKLAPGLLRPLLAHGRPGRISILVPSRGRADLLARSLRSLGSRELEVLVRVDDDDPQLDLYEELCRGLDARPGPGGTSLTRLLVGPRHGYGLLQHYYNELAAAATGDWLLLWNDDCLMQTAEWVDVVRRFDGRMAVLNPNTNHENWKIDMNVFPILPRRMVELMGHFSLSLHNDTWIEYVAREARIMVRVPIIIHHDRADLTGNNQDAVYAGRQLEKERFRSDELARERERDTQAVRVFLEHNPQARLTPSLTRLS